MLAALIMVKYSFQGGFLKGEGKIYGMGMVSFSSGKFRDTVCCRCGKEAFSLKSKGHKECAANLLKS